jgi:hypothetical protein
MSILKTAVAAGAAMLLGASLSACNTVEDDQPAATANVGTNAAGSSGSGSSAATGTAANSSATHSSTVNPTNPADPAQTPAAGQSTTR